MRPLSRQTFGAFFGRLFQCYDFENFENRSAKPVYTTLRDDTDRRGQGDASPPHPFQIKMPSMIKILKQSL